MTYTPAWGGLTVLTGVSLKAGTTARAQIKLAPGVAPSAPVEGDIWYSDADACAYLRNDSGSNPVLTGAVGANEMAVGDGTGKLAGAPAITLDSGGLRCATQFFAADGAQGAPGYAFYNDQASGVFSLGDDTVVLAAGYLYAVLAYSDGGLQLGSWDVNTSPGAGNTRTQGDHLIVGDLKVSTAGKGLFVKEGSNAKMGIATLVGGTVTVATTAVGANSRIFLTNNVNGGTAGFLRVSARVNGTSFTILSSSGTDTSQIAWMIVDPS